MSMNLLTEVITELVAEYAKAKEYGVSLVTIPDFDYCKFAANLPNERKTHVFFLGFAGEIIDNLNKHLPKSNPDVEYYFTVEAAEASRNSGDEEIFRVLVIKRAEIEKISSLRWFPEIGLEKVYTKSCDMVKKRLSNSNLVIESLIQALRSKPVRNILSFERVLAYLEQLLSCDEDKLPQFMKDNFFKLGLCSDRYLDSGNPNKDDFIAKIKRNYSIVERISSLEQAERQSITNYYSKDGVDKEIPRLILSYYKTRDVSLLKNMDLDEVEKCLKAAKKTSSPSNPKKGKESRVKPTALAAQLVFDDNLELINDILIDIEKELIDKRTSRQKNERIDIDSTDVKFQITTEPITETIATELASDDNFGGIIRVDVQSPSDAIRDKGKYEPELFKKAYLDIVWKNLDKISTLIQDGESISKALRTFIDCRDKLVDFRTRLQDAPMLQVLAKYSLFEEYLKSYERLLLAINDDFPKIWSLAPSNAKEIINAVMSLDYVFIVGETKHHAIPTPLHPLYLWKYVELAKEMLAGKGVDKLEETHLSEEDKLFIIRKADDIPDPLSVMLMPVTVSGLTASFLPLSGRIGSLPVYSNQPQINQSESGIETLKQQIIRYLCLYPHAGMMLKLAVIDPPSVEVVVSMLKALNNDKEFNISGIEVSIYRTKEVPDNWVEIEDESLNDGMLGKIRGKRSLAFKLKIASQRKSYNQILGELDKQQHVLVLFDPNEVRIQTAQNNKHIHIHPLCVPKIYQYNPVDEKVEIRPASEGGIFTVYSSIIEKLNEHPSSFSHTGTFFHTPLKRETYEMFLSKSDWLVILDQSLKNWDISLRAASEKLFYRENSYRSVGIYSNNCKKFIVGYDTLIKELGNYIPKEDGIMDIIEAIREVNDDGLLSIVSHTSNRIFDMRHGKGSLGMAIAALTYKRNNPNAFIVGLDTQLAQEWLSEREDGRLPDLIGINVLDNSDAVVDIIEVKTHSDSSNSFVVNDGRISGHAVEQTTVLESLIREMFGSTERITTVSRREILREQIFEVLFHTKMESAKKLELSNKLNDLFAGKFNLQINKNIYHIDFENSESSKKQYKGENDYINDDFWLTTVGSKQIQAILSGVEYVESAEIVSKTPVTEKDDDAGTSITSTDEGSAAMVTEVKSEAKLVVEEVPKEDKRIFEEKCAKLNKVFRDYGIQAYPVTPDKVQEAARFTRFTVELKSGEQLRSLERVKSDIGIQLEAYGEILIDHIRGTRYISVDVPFGGTGGAIKLIDNLHLLDKSNGRLDIVAGQTADSKIEVMDMAKAPHMLIAGTTGSGKTIFLYSIIVSLLHKYAKDELEFLIIDPKQTDFVFFEDLPNLYGGHVVVDAEEALEMIRKINDEDKEQRMQQLRSCRSRDIDSYNEKNPENKMKRLVVIVDEYADLIQTAEMQGNRKEFEKLLSMLAQKVRSLGIHLIIATQRPSANIVTGVLKANIPYRVSFRLPSHTDSMTILDMPGAENLLGKGDMLMVTDGSDVKRMQGLFISEQELENFVSSM